MSEPRSSVQLVPRGSRELVHPIWADRDPWVDVFDPEAVAFQTCRVVKPDLACPCGTLRTLWVVEETGRAVTVEGGPFFYQISRLDLEMSRDRTALLEVVYRDFLDRVQRLSSEQAEGWMLRAFRAIGLRRHLS